MVAWSWPTRKRQPDIFSLREWQQHHGKWRYTAKEVKISNSQGHISRSPVANVSIFPLSSSKLLRDMCFFSHEYRRDVCFFVFLRDMWFFSHEYRRRVCLITYLCNIPSCCFCYFRDVCLFHMIWYHGQNESGSVHFFLSSVKLNKWTKNSQVSKIELIHLIRQTTHLSSLFYIFSHYKTLWQRKKIVEKSTSLITMTFSAILV